MRGCAKTGKRPRAQNRGFGRVGETMSVRYFDLLRATLFATVLVLAAFAAGPLQAQSTTPPPDKIDKLIELLSDPDVKAWLAAQDAKPATPPPATEAGAAQSAMAPATISSGLDVIRAHIRGMVDAVPTLPAQFERAWVILGLEFEDEGLIGIVALIIGLIAVGIGLVGVVFRFTQGYRDWMKAIPKSTAQGRARSLGARLIYATIMTAVFVLGTAGVFLAFNWPPLLREIVLGYLSVAIATWGAMALCRVFLVPPSLGVPQAEAVRVFPMSDARAQHWYRWFVVNVFWLMFVLVTFALMGTFGFDRAGRFALSIPTSFVQVLLILAAIWLRPRQEGAPAEPGLKASSMTRAGWSWALTFYFTLVWVVQVAGAWRLYWLLIAAAALPWAIVMTRRGVHYLLRAPDAESGGKPLAPVVVATIERAIRLALIVAAATLLARVWGLEMAMMASSETVLNRILRGLLNAAVIVLAADFGWSIIKAIIAHRLGSLPGPEAAAHGNVDPKQARLRTLLPIFQNMLLATIVVMVVLMVLSSMGIEIGPLIAGAGVAGVAIGFGAQTLVKDVIAGIFYLLDDAFRVGEYIQSGNYKGTVESFSLRSVKLRHHRGYIFTVPFGELGAVQNMSRDWVIDKFSINVDFDTDVEKARKIVKKIGQQFAEDPEYAPHIIEPMKMQGVQSFGDYGIELRVKMMTKPGEQFVIKRKAFVAIKKAFEEAGIRIASPSVQVRGGDSPAAAAAHLQEKLKQEAAANSAAAS
jgi:moderate conductance mechanosensitive channel